MKDGFSENRYRDTTLVKVPKEYVDEFRRFNKQMAEACPRLPPYDDTMIYAALTKKLGLPYVFLCPMHIAEKYPLHNHVMVT